jgi:peptide/nickel transport system substrate-binding protein
VEPETLYLYGGSWAAQNVLEAIYDGPIDHRTYDFQPVILEKLPTLEDGDAYFEATIVQAGDWVVDAFGESVQLEEGVQLLPSHTCWDVNDQDCVVTFDGSTPVEMEQMVVYWQILEDVTWSDGAPVTAEDSVYSYELACDPDTPAPPSVKDVCEYTASYTAWGAHTTVWTGLPGYVDDLFFLNFATPLPSHLWRDQLGHRPIDLLSQPESTRQPLGWGPFVVTEWVEGEYLRLERNPQYFRASEGLPLLDEVVFRFAPDINGVITMLLAGNCDIGLLRDGQMGRLHGELGEAMPLLVAAQNEGLLDLIVSPSEVWEHLEFGINPVPTYDRPDFFEDVRVRQAFAHCIDRQTLVEEVTYGLGRIADSYVPPDHPLFAGNLVSDWEYDPDAAQALLAEAGWIDEDEDGVLEAFGVPDVPREASFRVEMLLVADDQQRDTIARILRSNLSECGIHLELTYLPLETFLADGPQGPLMGRQYDLTLFHWFNEVEPPCELYLTEQIPDQGDWGRFNIAGFSDEQYDQVCRSALGALPETREYEDSHREAQSIFTEQLPDIPLFWWVRLAIARPGATNLALDPSEESQLWDIESLSLEQ